MAARRAHARSSTRKATTDIDKLAAPTEALGVTGLRHSYGYVWDEFLNELRGYRGRRIYRQMRDNDSVIGAILFAIEALVRGVEWRFEPADDESDAALEQAQFFEEAIFEDMETAWPDQVGEILSMLPFGFHFAEKVYKRRIGPFETDDARRSKFTDGRIALFDLQPRAQETLKRWIFDERSKPLAFVQTPPTGTPLRIQEIVIPFERGVLWRTGSHKGSPEGRSILRNAYRSWWLLKGIQDHEAIGIERDLSGLPIIRIPNQKLASTNASDVAVKDKYEKIARDLKFNEQAGLVIPSDLWINEKTGEPVPSAYLVGIELLSTVGRRMIDTIKVKTGYQTDIARTVLMDFIMLGSTATGSFALGESKVDLAAAALEFITRQIAAPFNSNLIPDLALLNGFDMELLPRMKAGKVNPADLNELGEYVKKLADSGMPWFPDDRLENYLRNQANLPEKDEDSLAMALQDMARRMNDPEPEADPEPPDDA